MPCTTQNSTRNSVTQRQDFTFKAPFMCTIISKLKSRQENYNERKLQKTLENPNRPRHEQRRPHKTGKDYKQYRSQNGQGRRCFYGEFEENLHCLGLRDWGYYGSECG